MVHSLYSESFNHFNNLERITFPVLYMRTFHFYRYLTKGPGFFSPEDRRSNSTCYTNLSKHKYHGNIRTLTDTNPSILCDSPLLKDGFLHSLLSFYSSWKHNVVTIDLSNDFNSMTIRVLPLFRLGDYEVGGGTFTRNTPVISFKSVKFL